VFVEVTADVAQALEELLAVAREQQGPAGPVLRVTLILDRICDKR